MQPCLCWWLAVTRAEVGALPICPTLDKRFWLGTKRQLGQKSPCLGVPFPQQPEDTLSHRRVAGQQSRIEETCSKAGKASAKPLWCSDIETCLQVLLNSTWLLTPANHSILHPGLSWRVPVLHGENSLPTGPRTLEDLTLLTNTDLIILWWCGLCHSIEHLIGSNYTAMGRVFGDTGLQCLTMSDGCLFMRASNVPLQIQLPGNFFSQGRQDTRLGQEWKQAFWT